MPVYRESILIPTSDCIVFVRPSLADVNSLLIFYIIRLESSETNWEPWNTKWRPRGMRVCIPLKTCQKIFVAKLMPCRILRSGKHLRLVFGSDQKTWPFNSYFHFYLWTMENLRNFHSIVAIYPSKGSVMRHFVKREKVDIAIRLLLSFLIFI